MAHGHVGALTLTRAASVATLALGTLLVGPRDADSCPGLDKEPRGDLLVALNWADDDAGLYCRTQVNLVLKVLVTVEWTRVEGAGRRDLAPDVHQ